MIIAKKEKKLTTRYQDAVKICVSARAIIASAKHIFYSFFASLSIPIQIHNTSIVNRTQILKSILASNENKHRTNNKQFT